MLRQRLAHIWFLQETKIELPDDTPVATGLRAGYRLFNAPASRTDRDGLSGGVTVAVSSLLDVCGLPLITAPARAITVPIRLAGIGKVHLASVYLPVGDLFKEGSPAHSILFHLLATIQSEGTHFIIGGDFNQDPTTVAPFLINVPGVQILTPTAPTCYTPEGPARSTGT